MLQYEGMVYRPPSEARSLIVQVTIGCTHNECTFCTMYKDKQFRVRKKAEILADFQEAYEMYGDNIERIFLADGDALVVRTQDLLEILEFVRDRFPSVARITAYGTPSDIMQKSEEELRTLADAGLEMVYMGAESGDAVTLVDINKGVTREEIITAGQKLRRCGIKSSITLISGLGGRARKVEHAVESAKLISEIKPDYVGFLTLMLDEAAPIYQEIEKGNMELLTPMEVIEEMQLFLQNVDSQGTVFRANHASNYVMLKGNLNDDIEAMLFQLEAVSEKGQYRSETVRRL